MSNGYQASEPFYQTMGSGPVGRSVNYQRVVPARHPSGTVSYPNSVYSGSGSFETLMPYGRSGSMQTGFPPNGVYGGVRQGNVISQGNVLSGGYRAMSNSRAAVRFGSREGYLPTRVMSSSSIGPSMPQQSANTIGGEIYMQRTTTRPEATGPIVAVEKSLQQDIEGMTDDQIWKLHETLSWSNQAKVFERTYVSATGFSASSSMSSQFEQPQKTESHGEA